MGTKQVVNIPPEKRKHLDFEVWEKEVLKNPEILREYEKQQPEFVVIQAMIDARRLKGMTQEKLAKKMGTTQSAISRLEKGNISPTVSFLQKLADALGTKLKIEFLQ